MKVLTVATEKRGYFYALEESCRRHGYDLVVLGLGQEWKGFSMKFQLIVDYLKNTDPNETIVVVDGYDTIMLQPSSILRQKINHLPPDKVLFGKEQSNWHLFFQYGKTIKENVYINSGIYIGRVKSIRRLLENLCVENKCNKSLEDQNMVNSYYKQTKDDKIIIDTNSAIIFNFEPDSNFFTTRPIIKKEDIAVQRNQILFYGKIGPCILHGKRNTDMDHVCELLELPKEVPKEYHKYHGWKVTRDFLTRFLSCSLHYLLGIFINLFPIICLFFNIKQPLWIWFVLLIIYHIVVLQWYILGNCVFHHYENDYNYKKFPALFNNNGNYSPLMTIITTLSPLAMTLVILSLIYIQYISPCHKRRRLPRQGKMKRE